MTKTQLIKITLEIDRLMKEAKRSEAKANFEEREFEDAWRQYGSELAGPPRSIEINRNTAKELKRKAGFLESVKNGKFSLDDLPRLEKNIALADAEIERQNKAKVAMYGEMSLLRYLAELIK